LKQQLTSAEASLQTRTQTKQDLFNRFGGMLLGYISEVVKNNQVAEQYLVDVFNQLQFSDIQDITKPGINTFVYLQAIVRKKLAVFTSSIDGYANTGKPKTFIIKGNKFVDLMNPDQQQVFCEIYYHGKTVTNLAAELNKTEAAIRELLREAFILIRSNR
jgi:hypothetical protein